MIFFHTVKGYENVKCYPVTVGGTVNRLMTDDTCVSEQLDCTNNGTPTSKCRIFPLDSDSESNKAKLRSCAVHRIFLNRLYTILCTICYLFTHLL